MDPKKKEQKSRIYFIIKIILFSAILFFTHFYEKQILAYKVPAAFLKAINFYLYANIIISLARVLLVFLYLKRRRLRSGIRSNFIVGVGTIANILLALSFVIALLLLFEVDPIELITSLSIVAAALALLSKDYITNMINGMIIMFSDELSINDEIKIGEVKGKIVDITLNNIHIVNDDEDLIYVPNTLIFTSQIMNYTKRSVRKVSFEFDLKNSFLEDVAAVEKTLIEALIDYKSYIKQDSYNLKIMRVNENFSAMKFQFTLHRESAVKEKEMRRIALRKVLNMMNSYNKLRD